MCKLTKYKSCHNYYCNIQGFWVTSKRGETYKHTPVELLLLNRPVLAHLLRAAVYHQLDMVHGSDVDSCARVQVNQPNQSQPMK